MTTTKHDRITLYLRVFPPLRPPPPPLWWAQAASLPPLVYVWLTPDGVLAWRSSSGHCAE